MGVEPAFVCDGKVKSCVVTTNGTICFLFWLLFDLRHRMKASVKTAKLISAELNIMKMYE